MKRFTSSAALLCAFLLIYCSSAAAQAQNYCTAFGMNSSYEYIDAVTVEGEMNASGDNGGYADFTSEALVELAAGASASISLEPGFGYSSYYEYWKVFIDYNQNGSFDDAGEEVAGGYSNSIVNDSFVIPATATPGPTVMRVLMRYGSNPLSCGSFSWGEVEDYTVVISGDVDPGTGKTELNLDSEPGHWIGQGINATFTEDQGEFLVSANYNGDSTTGIRIRYEGSNGTYYHLSFDAPNDELLEAKTYTGATRFPFNDGDEPGLSVSTNGRGCNKVFGEFTVQGVSYAPDGSFESFGATFTHYCENTSGPVLTGSIYVNFEDLALNYCEASAKYSTMEWIAGVKIEDFENTVNQTVGYEDFTEAAGGQVIPVNSGATAVQLTPGFSGYAYSEHWAIWIDANKDGDFDDAGEELFRTPSKTNSVVDTTINIPASLEGKTRLRVRLYYSSSTAIGPCGETTYGQVEDYTVEAAPLCSLDSYTHSYQQLAAHTSDRDTAIGDFDGDGNNDVLVVLTTASLVFFGDGSGALSAPTPIDLSGSTYDCDRAITADLDNDGKDEILCRDIFARQLTLVKYKPTPAGDWIVSDIETGVPYHSTGGGLKRLITGDLDNDGDLDIVFVEGINPVIQSKIVIIRNLYSESGQLSFEVAQTVEHPDNTYEPQTPVLADFNGDGLLDIAQANARDYNSSNKKITVLLNQGSFAFQATRYQITTAATGGAPIDLFARDVNDDGSMDLIAVLRHSFASYSLQALLNNGSGFGTNPAPVLQPLTEGINSGGTIYRSVQLLDLEGDGIDELLLQGWTADYAQIYSAVPGTNFTFNTAAAPAHQVKVHQEVLGDIQAHYSRALSWGSLNGDSFLDFVNTNGSYVSPSSTPVMFNVNWSVADCS